VLDLASVRNGFHALYGTEPRLFSAPGRVNLIGEHTDYNDGFALPMAIDRRTVVAAAGRVDRKVRVLSKGTGESLEFDLDRPSPRRKTSWLDYIEGTARCIETRNVKLSGADLFIDSDVPVGAGLSSSAALEISVGLAMTSLVGDRTLTRTDLALAGQAAEQAYVGTMCGVMDQFIAALGQADHALLIDCRTLEAKPVPLTLGGAILLICDTGVKHELASSEYNLRRAECQRGVELLRHALPDVRALRDVSLSQFDEHGAMLADPVRKRCRHVVTENARTLAAVRALAEKDLGEFGRLMAASHRSLQEDYEVTCPELDLCVDVATALPGVYGARMTGGGFGGCTVNLVEREFADSVSNVLRTEFEGRFGRRPDIFTSRASQGATAH
jgi:galactokinase